MSYDDELPVLADSDPPDSDDDAALDRIEALYRDQIRSLDRMVAIVTAHPPPTRDPAPSAPPG